jgi:uncharacterized surface anchored protein
MPDYTLGSGNYVICETHAPAGYFLDSPFIAYGFEISSYHQEVSRGYLPDAAEEQDIVFSNPKNPSVILGRYGGLTLKTIDRDSLEPLAQATYAVYSGADFDQFAGELGKQRDTLTREDLLLIHEQHQEAEMMSFETGTDGTASTSKSALPLGNEVVLFEVDTPPRYYIPDEEPQFYSYTPIESDGYGAEVYAMNDGTEADMNGFLLVRNIPKTGGYSIEVVKKMNGKDLEAEEFTFELQDPETHEVLKTVKNEQDGTVSFGDFEVSSDEIGKTIEYDIIEKVGDEEGVEYDRNVLHATINIESGEDTEMQCIVSYRGNLTEFQNFYEEKPPVPTGFPIGFAGAGLMLMAVIASAAISCVRVRRETAIRVKRELERS